MRFFFLSFILISSIVRAEGMPQNDQEFMRYMQAKAEQAQREDEIKNPKKPEMGKDRAVLGDRNAKIKLFVYSDFQCPYCKRGYETVEELKKKYGKKLVVTFKHLPLPFHPMAMPAAKRFEAIALQSPKKAYAFHDEVFKNQERIAGGEAFLDEMVKKVGANLDKVKKDMESPVVQRNIASDQEEAQKFGIQGTPGFVIAGVTIKGAYPVEAFEEILQKRFGNSEAK
ncbi:MAG: thiol:disulfide interchange protein [Proteobacteria bacterium]|jgi:protein-disulfide isomerase|nr:thiol:disulfide interchange protein [Pseudomonadota bacterium]